LTIPTRLIPPHEDDLGPLGAFTHSASATGLPQGVSPEELPVSTLQGNSDFQRTGYGGPCPPVGRHRYFHKLYALDVVLPDLKEAALSTMWKRPMKGMSANSGVDRDLSEKPVNTNARIRRLSRRRFASHARLLQCLAAGHRSRPA